MPEWIARIDTALFYFINLKIQNSMFDALMPFITNRWYLTALPFLVFYMINAKRDGKLNDVLAVFGITIFSILFADGIANVIKHLIMRERPCNAFEDVHLLAGCSKSFSMPSNHAANTFAFAVPFLLMTKSRIKYVFLFISALVAFSRVYIGVHYPFDVVVGAIVGSASSISVIYLYFWAKRRFADKPYTTLLLVFLTALSVFRIYYIIFGPLDLTPDEAHYWEWSRRLDLSYYSKGPLVAYLIFISKSIFGNTEFGVRFFAPVFSALSSVVLYRLGSEMYSEKVGTSAAILIQIIPLFSTFGILFTIDSPFIFFWILSLYLFWKAVENPPIPPFTKEGEGGFEEANQKATRHSSLNYWLLLGVSVGLGLLAKYTMAFFYLSAFLFIISLKQQRRLLKTPYPYAALLISIVVFSPVIIWNYLHDWVTLRHTAGHIGVYKGMQISLKYFFDFVGSQFGFVTPVLLVMMIAALWKTRPSFAGNPTIPPLTKEGEGGFERVLKNSFLFWFSVPMLAFFLIKSLQSKVQTNWAIAGYITVLIAFSAIYINNWRQQKKYLKGIIIAGAVIPLLLTATGLYSYKLNMPVEYDMSAWHRTWEKLGREVSALHNDMGKEGSTFIFSDNYQVTSELAFYVEGQPAAYCANLGRRMTQYDLWPGFNNLLNYNAVFVTITDTEVISKITKSFDKCEKRLLDIKENGRVLRTYTLLLCRGFKGMKEEGFKRY